VNDFREPVIKQPIGFYVLKNIMGSCRSYSRKRQIGCKESIFTAKRKPPHLEVVYNIYKKINSKAMPLKAFWLENHHLLCRGSFTAKERYLDVSFNERF